MKQSVDRLSELYALFIALLLVGSLLPAPFYDVLVLGTVLLLWLSERGKIRDPESLLPSRPLKETLRFALPLLAPAVTVIFAVSALTSLVMGLLGVENPPVEILPWWKMLLFYGIFPVIEEEFFFRFLPLRWLGKDAPAFTVAFSSLMFALVHCDFLKMPYAFLAGVIFISADLAVGNVLPSVCFHFVNNLLSVLLTLLTNAGFSVWIFVGFLAVLCAVSAVFLVRNRNDYRKLAVIPRMTLPAEEKTPLPLVPALLACAMAVTRLLFA